MAENLGTSTKVKAHTIYRNASGKRIPGVTTILGVIDKPALMHWAWSLGLEGIDFRKYRDEKADIGTLAHAMITGWISGNEPTTWEYSADIISQAENSVLSFYAWLGEREYELGFVEIPLISEILQVGGTCDIYWKIDGLWTLDDLKTGKAIYGEHKAQASIYGDILRENGWPVDRVRIINVPRVEDENFDVQEVQPYTWPKYREFFRACQVIYNTRKTLKM